MIAVDTNVLVRLVTADDRVQKEAAVRALAGERVRIAKTVLLETAWVLRHAYELDRDVILDALTRIVALQEAEVEDEVAVLRALDWAAAGLDFADALHLASGAGAAGFLTFDRRLSTRAAKVGCAVPVRLIRR